MIKDQPCVEEVNMGPDSSSSSSSSEGFTNKITNGGAVDPGDYPFIARMSMRDPNLGYYCRGGRCGSCGATLISAGNSKSGKSAYLMTAGHCCAEPDKNIYQKSSIWPLARNITKYDITFELGAVYDKTCNTSKCKFQFFYQKKNILSVYKEQKHL